VHAHTDSFAKALRGALREDPDVIMVGEMRDLETIQLALTAAETGHLVLGTLHTGNAPRTLDRVLDVFPTDQREQIRIMVSESLRGILSQQLVPRADGVGRVMALELLVNTPAVANCIREGKTFMLPGVMQTGKNVGMITMDESLRRLYVKGVITPNEALFRAEDKVQMRSFFQS
jgi:twitching motility protein PilT